MTDQDTPPVVLPGQIPVPPVTHAGGSAPVAAHPTPAPGTSTAGVAHDVSPEPGDAPPGASRIPVSDAEPPARKRPGQVLPLVLSALSLLVAAASAVFAYNASRDAFVSDRRSELITVVTQLNEKSQDSELEEGAEFLIAQAVWLTRTVPDVPAAVYRQIAAAIVNETPTYQEEALPLLEEGLKRAAATDDEYEQVAALRVRAQIYESQSELEAMRADYRSAIALSAAYDGPNLQRQHTVPAFTHVYWGQAEARAGKCDDAADQLSSARRHAAVITGSNLEEWMAALDAAIQACRSAADAGRST